MSPTRRDLIRSGLALSTYSLLPGSLSKAHALLAKHADVKLADDSTPVGPRERFSFDFGWKFFQGHATDPRRDLDFGVSQDDLPSPAASNSLRENSTIPNGAR